MDETQDGCFFQKIEPRRFPAAQSAEQSDGHFWKGFRVRTTLQTGAVSSLSFSPVLPHTLAATSGTRIVLYDTPALSTTHALSKFTDLAHGGNFRSDGRLLVAGSEEGHVKVFSVADRALLRQFDGHRRPVHVALFGRELFRVLSASDDATVRLWDLSESKQLCRLDGHRDYVRAARQSPSSLDVWATGGYDHVCRLWDVRQRSAAMEFDHGAPIESVAFLPSGTLLVTAGGPFLSVWDVLATGRLLRRMETHHKTITAVDVIHAETASSTEPRLVSASLDQHTKFYDLAEFKTVHDARYKHPILSFAATPDGRSYAVGMSNGSIVLRDNRHKRQIEEKPPPVQAPAATIEYKKRRLSSFNNLIRKFRYRDALDMVLKEKDVRVVSAVMEELAARDGLVDALSGRSTEDLLSLLSYVSAHIGNPAFADHVLPLLERLLDLYDSELTAKPLEAQLNRILRALQRETSLLMEMQQLKGRLDMILFRTPM